MKNDLLKRLIATAFVKNSPLSKYANLHNPLQGANISSAGQNQASPHTHTQLPSIGNDQFTGLIGEKYPLDPGDDEEDGAINYRCVLIKLIPNASRLTQ